MLLSDRSVPSTCSPLQAAHLCSARDARCGQPQPAGIWPRGPSAGEGWERSLVREEKGGGVGGSERWGNGGGWEGRARRTTWGKREISPQ